MESSVQFQAPIALPLGGKACHNLLSRRLDGPQDRFGRSGEGTIYFYKKEDILLAILNACVLSLFRYDRCFSHVPLFACLCG
jgi:hypothetical protein